MRARRHLELYCGGMGSAVGYLQAGYDEVVGIDIHQRRDLPEGEPGLTFVKADVLDVLRDVEFIRSFDTVGASPPCQTHTRAKHLRDAQGKGTSKVDLIPQTRCWLDASGVPYVMENVEGAPLRHDLTLCGSMFPELSVEDETGRRWLKRHRVFEFGNDAPAPPPLRCCTCLAGCGAQDCGHRKAGVRALGVYASKSDNIPSGGQTARSLEEGRALMGIDWMSWSALVEAIPPAYTRYIGRHMLEVL